MKSIATPNRRKRRITAGVVLGVAVFASLTGAYAVHKLYDRPGEAALKFIPADSMLVADIDLVPSATQTLAFKHIDDSLSRNGMDSFLQKSVLELVDQSKTAELLRPLVLRSGAVCILQKEGTDGKPNNPDGVVLVALTDGAQAAQILQKSGYPQFYRGLKYYKTGKSAMLMMVVDNFLALTDDPKMFAKIKAVQNGEVPNITSVPEFLAAKQSVSDDANVMLYVSPKIAASVMGQGGPKVDLPQWAAVGLAIRDGGIGISCATKMDVAAHPGFATLAQTPAVRSDLFQVLPTGSYGMFAISGASNMFDYAKSTLTGNADAKDMDRQVAQMEDSVQKGIGLSVQKDLLPAFKGDAVAAIYPAHEGDPAGLNVLLLVDDSNGADPANAVDRFQAFVDQQTAKEGHEPKFFDEKQIAGGREFTLNAKAQSEMQKSIGDSIGKDTFKKNTLVGDKTVVFAMVGKAVFASTSQELLDRAIATYQSKTNGLTGDANFAPSEKTLLDGSQDFAAFSLSRIADGIKNTVDTSKMSAEAAGHLNDVLAMFKGQDEMLYLKGKLGPDGLSTGGIFVPLDYDKLIDMFGKAKSKSK